MTLPELQSLVRIGKLKKEPADASEFAGLVHSAEARLRARRYSGELGEQIVQGHR